LPGLGMKTGQWFALGNHALGVSDSMTIGFWLKPVNIGMAEQPITGAITPIRQPVLDVSVGSVDVTNSEIDETKQPIVLHEETQRDGDTNKLRIILDGNSYCEALSEAYITDKWHQFWVAWNGSTRSLKLFIDGKEATTTITGSVPSSMDCVTTVCSINRIALDADYDLMMNTGRIDDIFILDECVVDLPTIQQGVNYELGYVVDTQFDNIDETALVIMYDDPTANRITDIYNDKTYLFATRNDGQVLRGSPLIWQSRKDFANDDESDVLESFGSGITQANGFLEIEEGTIEL
jgi:hypothetical protein